MKGPRREELRHFKDAEAWFGNGSVSPGVATGLKGGLGIPRFGHAGAVGDTRMSSDVIAEE